MQLTIQKAREMYQFLKENPKLEDNAGLGDRLACLLLQSSESHYPDGIPVVLNNGTEDIIHTISIDSLDKNRVGKMCFSFSDITKDSLLAAITSVNASEMITLREFEEIAYNRYEKIKGQIEEDAARDIRRGIK